MDSTFNSSFGQPSDTTFETTFNTTFDTSGTRSEADGVNIVFTAGETAVLQSLVTKLRMEADSMQAVANCNPYNGQIQIAHLQAESEFDLVDRLYNKVVNHREIQGLPDVNPASP